MKVIAIALLPAVSIALHVTVVLPRIKEEPETGKQFEVPTGSMLSEVAGNEYETIAPSVVFCPTTRFACAAITGAILSMLVTVTVLVVISPAGPVAIKSKEPFAVNVCDVWFSVPMLVEAVTNTSEFVGAVL
jgi:hypothetical protein